PLRDPRGEGPIPPMVTEGIPGVRAHLHQVADGRFPEALIRQARGWPDEEWAAAAEALRGRGLLTPDASPALPDAGRAVLETIEAHTDDRAWTGGPALLPGQGGGGGTAQPGPAGEEGSAVAP